jgi:hypothetical protein
VAVASKKRAEARRRHALLGSLSGALAERMNDAGSWVALAA